MHVLDETFRADYLYKKLNEATLSIPGIVDNAVLEKIDGDTCILSKTRNNVTEYFIAHYSQVVITNIKIKYLRY